MMERITTGIKKLDSVMGGGFPDSTVTLLVGGPGTGKTLFSLNFLLEGALKGEKCYHMSFNESKSEILRACKGIKSLEKIDGVLDKTLIIEEVNLGKIIDINYLAKTFENYPKIDRLVIDNMNKLLLYANNNKEFRMRFSELVRYLKKNVKCAIFLYESMNQDDESYSGQYFEVDGVVDLSFIDLEEKPKRILSIMKMRYTDFEPRVPHVFKISKEGLSLGEEEIV